MYEGGGGGQVVSASVHEGEDGRAKTGDAIIDAALELIPLLSRLRTELLLRRAIIGELGRKFGPEAYRHLWKLYDDLWQSTDAFVTDVTELAKKEREAA